MKIYRSETMGMCFGVRDAIQLALRKGREKPVTILGELVHNETVLESLRSRGIGLAQDLPQVGTRAVMITAHGASDRRLAEVRSRGHEVVEATCPLVHFAHRAVKQLVEAGYHPVIIGKRDHVEVRGLTEDLEACDIIQTEAEVAALAERPRYGVAAQTTQPIHRVLELVALIQERFPRSEVRFVDTVCRPTKQRQTAAEILSGRVEVMVVVGGDHSNNTRELAQTCRRHCSRVHQVQTASALQEAWFDGVESVGLTAGTSTPDSTIEEVEQWLQALASRRPVGAAPRQLAASNWHKAPSDETCCR